MGQHVEQIQKLKVEDERNTEKIQAQNSQLKIQQQKIEDQKNSITDLNKNSELQKLELEEQTKMTLKEKRINEQHREKIQAQHSRLKIQQQEIEDQKNSITDLNKNFDLQKLDLEEQTKMTLEEKRINEQHREKIQAQNSRLKIQQQEIEDQKIR